MVGQPRRNRRASADSSAAYAGSSAPISFGGQLFQQGRQDYLAGRYDEAVAKLEAASRASHELSDSDRERLPGSPTSPV